MVNVRFFGMARINFDRKEEQFDAKDINQLLQQLSTATGVKTKELKKYIYFVNDVNIFSLKKYKTQLVSGDEVLILSPSSGG